MTQTLPLPDGEPYASASPEALARREAALVLWDAEHARLLRANHDPGDEDRRAELAFEDSP